ncbi:queuosine precursor transporter [bacterium]|nr:queuosine precursor transporter [bacterium]
MTNELLFIFWTLIAVSGVLAAFSMGGKAALYGVIGVYIVLANVFVAKQITLFGLAATGGNALYGALFLATDLISEYWGKREARKAVWFGWACAFAFLIATQVFLLFKPSGDDFVDPAMRTLFDLTPRIVIGSLIAYIVSQSHDVFAFHFWKQRTNGKHLWLRNNASTVISQLIDSLLFSLIAFFGVFPLGVVIQIAISTYLLKVLVAVLDTPFMYLSRRIRPSELQGQDSSKSA